ncbi:unnamed protein product [Clonostachys byssicola]|uniref:Uncharacterized protein n=1 Tax=Clonostachys byssicola TaxID=160290 RepID=A0A9N9UQG4_9HYPO|nr:unnamed protein product [Clonostachys byssicola]
MASPETKCPPSSNIHVMTYSNVDARLPPIRALIFDMDGLLINSEDIIHEATNTLLEKYGRPSLTQSMRAKLMGVAGSTNSDMFHDWAQLPIPREQFRRELGEQMKDRFPNCEPLAGAEALLSNLCRARNISTGAKIELALASNTKSTSYELKVSRPKTRRLLACFQSERRVLGDDPRLREGRTKPLPDIYLIALDSLNSTLDPALKPIQPNECLVLEDSVAGVEAGRRAGMRVIWVPHPILAFEYQSKEKDILSGRSGIFNIGDDWQLGEVDDGWAESIPSLRHFDYGKYDIHVPL